MTTLNLITYELLTEYDGLQFDIIVDIVDKKPVLRKIKPTMQSAEAYRQVPHTLRYLIKDGASEQALTYVKSELMVRQYA